MKKIKHLAITVLFSLLISGFVGCKSNADDPLIPDADEIANTLQALIDNATEGSTITLDPALAGTVITISKKLNINANGIENLSVILDPEVASNVKLSKFINAVITITDTTAGRSAHARSAGSSSAATGKPREIGDDNAKLYLEDCTFEKITAEKDITLFMTPDEKKSLIKELELKAGVEDFVVIEDGDENLANTKKSVIEKLTIEKGVDEVDLAGAYYKDLEFKGTFGNADKVDFFYDKKGDQVKAEFEAKLAAEAAKANAKDICAVRNGSGTFKKTIAADQIDNLNGAVSIILLTDEQKDAIIAKGKTQNPTWEWASLEKPYYEIAYTGLFKYITDDTDVHGVYGNMTEVYDPIEDQTVEFSAYRAYTKEAVCTEKQSDGSLVLYLNLANVVKSDLKTCAFKADGLTDEYYTTPRMITDIDLEGYKPYLAVEIMNYLRIANNQPFGSYYLFEEDEDVYNNTFGPVLDLYDYISENHFSAPRSKFGGNYGGASDVFITTMESTSTYPDVSDVVITTWDVPSEQ